MILSRFFLKSLAIPFVLSLAITSARAQITNVTADQATPIPGGGHDYVHVPSETVNPADGSVSVRINVPIPNGRGFTIPFAFAYDSNGVHHLGQFTLGKVAWLSNTGLYSQGGWAYTVPLLTVWGFVNKDPVFGNCFYTGDYTFQDFSGSRHALGLAAVSTTESACSAANASSVYSGGDDIVSAVTSPMQGTSIPPVTVVDRDGTVFSFRSPGLLGQGLASYAIASTVEDRNGNLINITPSSSGATYTDTVGRNVLSFAGFSGAGNTVAVSGLPNPYVITWGTANANFTPGSQVVGPNDPNCWPIGGLPPESAGSIIRNSHSVSPGFVRQRRAA